MTHMTNQLITWNSTLFFIKIFTRIILIKKNVTLLMSKNK